MLLAALRTLATGVFLVLYILTVGISVLFWTVVSRRPALLYRVAAVGVRAGFGLAGIRLRVSGREHLVAGAVFACNHSSNIEPPAVFLALEPVFPKLAVLYKAELRRVPVLVWAFDVAGFVPLERDNPDQSRPAIDRAAKSLEEGTSFLVFPEGTRSRSGELLPFKKGGFVLAIKAQAPIVPVAVTGARAAMRRGSPLIWPTVVAVDIGAPIPTSGLSLDDRDALAARVRDAIASRLASAPPSGR